MHYIHRQLFNLYLLNLFFIIDKLNNQNPLYSLDALYRGFYKNYFVISALMFAKNVSKLTVSESFEP